MTFGSRFIGTPRRALFFWHTMMNNVLTLLSNMLNDLNITDMETCYKVFRPEVIKAITIEENRFGIEPELTAKVAKMQPPHLRGPGQLPRPHLRRGQEDRLEGRRPRPLLHRQVRRPPPAADDRVERAPFAARSSSG